MKSFVFMGVVWSMTLAISQEIGRSGRQGDKGQVASELEPSVGSLHASTGLADPPDFSRVPDAQWQAIERSVDRGIAYLLRQQKPDGSFGVNALERPAITALVAMALISRGHVPSEQPGASAESKALIRAIDAVLARQNDEGLIGHLPGRIDDQRYNKFVVYNHGICGTFLCEVYGMTGPARAAKIEVAVGKALKFIRLDQLRPLPARFEKRERGGWRYLNMAPSNARQSDLSVTSWYVMFLRSAENCGFHVPPLWADEALDYVRRCYDEKSGIFVYVAGEPQRVSRAMVGAGVLCLTLTGRQEPEMERSCGRWIVNHPFDRFNAKMNQHDHYYYAAYYNSQAALQIGGETWEAFYPRLANTLTRHQGGNGSWEVDSQHGELGRVYPTAMAILALTPPYQLLPIYQR